MWNIWKEEACKILSRRLIWIGLFVLAAFLTLRLVTEQGHYSASIDGNTYFGQEALEKDKQLAAQYAGILTEETVRRIYENFGFAWTRIGIATLAPLLGLHLTKAVTYLACSMPFLLSMQWGFAFTRSQELIQFAIALAAGCICTGLAYYRFRNYQGL